MTWIEEIIKTLLQNEAVILGILITAMGILIYLTLSGIAKIAHALKQKP